MGPYTSPLRRGVLLLPFRYLWWLITSLLRSFRRPPAYVVFILEESLPALPDPPRPFWQRFTGRPRLSVKELGERFDAIGRDNIFKHDQELAGYAYEQLARLNNIRLFGPKTGRAGLVSFLLKDVHAHDVVTVADQRGVALRGGHHCTQPLMRKLGVESTARASFYFYNTRTEVDRFLEVVREIQKFFAG